MKNYNKISFGEGIKCELMSCEIDGKSIKLECNFHGEPEEEIICIVLLMIDNIEKSKCTIKITNDSYCTEDGIGVNGIVESVQICDLENFLDTIYDIVGSIIK